MINEHVECLKMDASYTSHAGETFIVAFAGTADEKKAT